MRQDTFVSTYATFLTMRACEQIRTDIAFANLNVRIVGTNVGFSSDWLGMTHQALEDVALMRSIPNMTVLVPADGAATYRLVEALINYEGPAYLRIRGTAKEPHVSCPEPVVIGKARKIRDGTDLTIIACGRLVYEAMVAADRWHRKGSKSGFGYAYGETLDEESVLKAAKETKRILTVEEHNVVGGLGAPLLSY